MERDVESFLRDELVKITAWAIKLFPIVISGIPDRLVIKNGRCWFVETKFKNGRISQKQKNVAKRLLKYGFTVYYIWDKDQVKEFIVKITNDLQTV